MFSALSRAISQLTDPRILRVIGLCFLLAVAVFALIWTGVGWLLSQQWFETEWLDSVAGWAGAILTLLLSWVLFVPVLGAFIGIFLESIAQAVEDRHYPHLEKAPGLPFWKGVTASVSFLGRVVVVNLLLFFPPAYSIVFLLANGYLISREYFELVAFRRLPPPDARALRQRHANELLIMGIGTAFLLTIPFVNVLAPVIATAMTVHRFEDWRNRAGYPAAGGG